MSSSANNAPAATDIRNWIADWRARGYTGTSTTESGPQFKSPGGTKHYLQEPIHPSFQVTDSAADDDGERATSEMQWREVSRFWVFHCHRCNKPVKHRVASTPTRAQQEEFKNLHFPRNCPKSDHYVAPVFRDTPTREIVASLSELHMRKKLTASSQLGREETVDVDSSTPVSEREMSVFEITDEDEIAQVRMEIKYNELRKTSLPYNQGQIDIVRKVVGGATLLGSVYFFVTKGIHLPENAGPVLARIGAHVVRAGAMIPEKLQPLMDCVIGRIVEGAAELSVSDTPAFIAGRVVEQLERIGISLPEELVVRIAD